MSTRGRLKRGQVIFSDEEAKEVEEYLRKKKLKMYTLLKKAVMEFMERHP